MADLIRKELITIISFLLLLANRNAVDARSCWQCDYAGGAQCRYPMSAFFFPSACNAWEPYCYQATRASDGAVLRRCTAYCLSGLGTDMYGSSAYFYCCDKDNCNSALPTIKRQTIETVAIASTFFWLLRTIIF